MPFILQKKLANIGWLNKIREKLSVLLIKNYPKNKIQDKIKGIRMKHSKLVLKLI